MRSCVADAEEGTAYWKCRAAGLRQVAEFGAATTPSGASCGAHLHFSNRVEAGDDAGDDRPSVRDVAGLLTRTSWITPGSSMPRVVPATVALPSCPIETFFTMNATRVACGGSDRLIRLEGVGGEDRFKTRCSCLAWYSKFFDALKGSWFTFLGDLSMTACESILRRVAWAGSTLSLERRDCRIGSGVSEIMRVCFWTDSAVDCLMRPEGAGRSRSGS